MLKRNPRLAVLFALLLPALALLWPGLVLAQAKEKVTISALPFISTSPIFIAKERGYFDVEGIDLDIKIFNAAQAVERQMPQAAPHRITDQQRTGQHCRGGGDPHRHGKLHAAKVPQAFENQPE